MIVHEKYTDKSELTYYDIASLCGYSVSSGVDDTSLESLDADNPVPDVETLETMRQQAWDAISPLRLRRLRNRRNRILAASDWTQAPDSPLDEAKKAEWQTYRQALRDITDTYTSLDDVVWPTKP